MVFILGFIGLFKVVEIMYGNYFVVSLFVNWLFLDIFVDVNVLSYLLFNYIVEQEMIVINLLVSWWIMNFGESL